MSDYEPLILAALNHQWQTTKKIAANVPAPRIEELSLARTCWVYLDRMKKAGLVEQQICRNPVRKAYWRLKE